MNPDTFAEWLRRHGHKVYRTPSSYWFDAGPRVLQAFPYHWVICPSPQEIRELMLRQGIMALRYSAPPESPVGRISYHIVRKPPYELEALKSQARNGIKAGLAHFQVEQISFERLATQGWSLQHDTLERQDRLRSMTREEWERMCRAADSLPGFEAWAALKDGQLASALIICRIEETFTVPYAMSGSCFLGEHVNNAIFYAVTREMLDRPGVREVFYTVQSLDAPPSVDDFKVRMGLTPKPVRQRVEFHPWMKPVPMHTAHNLFASLLQRDQSNPFVAKAEGMLRFHVEGKLPLSQQQWPDCVASCKEKLMNTSGEVHVQS